jgi:hypothetical protein
MSLCEICLDTTTEQITGCCKNAICNDCCKKLITMAQSNENNQVCCPWCKVGALSTITKHPVRDADNFCSRCLETNVNLFASNMVCFADILHPFNGKFFCAKCLHQIYDHEINMNVLIYHNDRDKNKCFYEDAENICDEATYNKLIVILHGFIDLTIQSVVSRNIQMLGGQITLITSYKNERNEKYVSCVVNSLRDKIKLFEKLRLWDQ